MFARYGSHVDTARILIAAGSDVNRQDQTQQSAYLIATSEIGPDAGLELLQLTLANGADVRSRDSYKGTGLIRAAERGYPNMVRELLQTKIEIDHVNRLQWTALLESNLLGDGGPNYTEIVAMLLKAGANPNLADGQGVTPLAHARSRSFDKIAEFLVTSGGTRCPDSAWRPKQAGGREVACGCAAPVGPRSRPQPGCRSHLGSNSSALWYRTAQRSG